jgi:hypothetical protein
LPHLLPNIVLVTFASTIEAADFSSYVPLSRATLMKILLQD